MGREDRRIADIDASAGTYHRFDHRCDSWIVPRRFEDRCFYVELRAPGEQPAQRRHELGRSGHGPRVRRAEAVRRAFDDDQLDLRPHALQLPHPERQHISSAAPPPWTRTTGSPMPCSTYRIVTPSESKY